MATGLAIWHDTHQPDDETYLAGDIAYHHNKFVTRGFDRVINVWGADHQGQVSSLIAGIGIKLST